MKILIEQERKAHILKVLPREQLTTNVTFGSDRVADSITDYKGASPYHLNYCGYEPCPPGYKYGPYVRKSFLLHLVAKGRGTFEKDESSFGIQEGQIFAIYPEEVTTYQASLDDPWKYYWIGFSGYQAEEILEQMGFSKSMPVITVNNMQLLIESIEYILSLTENSLGDELGRTGEMMRLFSQIIKGRPAKIAAKKKGAAEYAEYALRYISNNYDKNIKVSELARQIGVNRCYLTKTFTDIYRMSPQEYLIRLRIDHAKDLLVQSRMNITEIGAHCGYPDLFTFSRMFHRHIGCSPLEYRARFTDQA